MGDKYRLEPDDYGCLHIYHTDLAAEESLEISIASGYEKLADELLAFLNSSSADEIPTLRLKIINQLECVDDKERLMSALSILRGDQSISESVPPGPLPSDSQLGNITCKDFRFTPGPWMAEERSKESTWINAPNGDPEIGYARWDGLATVHGCEDDLGRKGYESMKANARLISAAPLYAKAAYQAILCYNAKDEFGLEVALSNLAGAHVQATGKFVFVNV